MNFINVPFGVAAEVPLTDYSAQFLFRFASREPPFLVSSTPYGGGGYVALTANSIGVVRFELSLIAGAVAPIKFGPSSAHERVKPGL